MVSGKPFQILFVVSHFFTRYTNPPYHWVERSECDVAQSGLFSCGALAAIGVWLDADLAAILTVVSEAKSDFSSGILTGRNP
jgi:hypothetical protein